MNIRKYDLEVDLLCQTATSLKGARDLEEIRKQLAGAKSAIQEIESALTETLLDLKEVPQFVGVACKCGESRITGARHCLNCGTAFVPPSGPSDDCG